MRNQKTSRKHFSHCVGRSCKRSSPSFQCPHLDVRNCYFSYASGATGIPDSFHPIHPPTAGVSVMFPQRWLAGHRSSCSGTCPAGAYDPAFRALVPFLDRGSATNRLLHAVDEESQYYGLNLKKSKCAVMSTTGRHAVKFKMEPLRPSTYLGGTVTRHVDIRAEIENRKRTTMTTWKRIHMSFKDTSCPVRWDVVVYDSMIRSKLL